MLDTEILYLIHQYHPADDALQQRLTEVGTHILEAESKGDVACAADLEIMITKGVMKHNLITETVGSTAFERTHGCSARTVGNASTVLPDLDKTVFTYESEGDSSPSSDSDGSDEIDDAPQQRLTEGCTIL